MQPEERVIQGPAPRAQRGRAARLRHPVGQPDDGSPARQHATPPDESVTFRMDFPRSLASLGHTKRRVAEDLMMGERTMDVAGRHGYSAGRISQLRRELMESWTSYGGHQ